YEQVPFSSEEEKQQLTGEVHFMRAYYYFMLSRMYGGVPVITNTFSLDDNETIQAVKRNTFEETVNFIVDECDKAIELTQESTPRGVANKSAARALKSRVLLYAASDLHNQSGNTNALIGYVDGDRAARWMLARE